jgi:hypothetical protein
LKAGGAERCRYLLGMFDYLFIRDDEYLAAFRALPGEGSESGDIAAGDGNVVTAFAELDADGFHKSIRLVALYSISMR